MAVFEDRYKIDMSVSGHHDWPVTTFENILNVRDHEGDYCLSWRKQRHSWRTPSELAFSTISDLAAMWISVSSQRTRSTTFDRTMSLMRRARGQCNILFFLSNHSTQDTTILQVLGCCQTFTTALLLFFRQGDYSYKKGTTAVLSQKIKRLQYDVLHERMEVSWSRWRHNIPTSSALSSSKAKANFVSCFSKLHFISNIIVLTVNLRLWIKGRIKEKWVSCFIFRKQTII